MALGDFFQPEVGPGPTQDTVEPDLKSRWDSWLVNPVNRNGLLGFGLQMMAGGWGNNFANSLSAGVESMAGTEKLMADDALRERARGDTLDNQDQNRQIEREKMLSDEKRTKMMVDGRASVATLRKTPSQLAAYNTAYREAMTAQQLGILSGDVTLEEAQMNALTAAEAAVSSAQSVGAAGSTVGTANSGPTSQANFGTGAPAGTTPPAAQTGVSGAPGGSKTRAYSDLKAKWGEQLTDEKIQQIEGMGYTITGKPGEMAESPAIKPTFKGIAKEGERSQFFRNEDDPAPTRDEAYSGQTYLGKDGYVYRKNIFGQAHDQQVNVKPRKRK
jgi:hypothetical protein